jgi:hypothetical protein
MLYASKVIIGEENKGGFIQSYDYVPGVSGFKIEWNGNVEFNNAKFRGHVEATSGTFHGRIEANEGFIDNLTAINLKTDGTLNGIPITGFARNHPASNATSISEDDYPIGTILLAVNHGGTSIPINTIANTIQISGGGYSVNAVSSGAPKLPGIWRISGSNSYITGSANNLCLIRRVS